MVQPVNETQRQFAKLCALGGGVKGGLAKGKVLELLRWSGQKINIDAYEQTKQQFDACPNANPWHICFAVGLAWGHLAKLETAFTGHVASVLADWNDYDLSGACSYHLERGPEPIRRSLVGAYTLFQQVALPASLPASLSELGAAQNLWLTPILKPSRPPYIGSWNATAMFMAALFAQPSLAKSQKKPTPILPPGGPIFAGLKILHATHVVSKQPSGSSLDDADFESGVLVENNALLAELVDALPDWSLLDAHSGVYMLGTRDPRSDGWL